MPKVSEIIDLLFKRAAEASRTREPRRTELIEEALDLACNFLTRLNHDIEDYIKDVLKQCELGAEGTSVPLSDLARSNEKLEIFLNRETLRDFLNATGEILGRQGELADERIEDLKNTILNSFDQMLEQSLNRDELIKNFLILKAICCRPPDGSDSDDPETQGDGGSGSGKKWKIADKVLDILSKLAAIGSLFVALHQAPQTPHHSPHPVPHAPVRIKTLILLLLSALAHEAAGLDLLPPEVREIIDGGSDTAKVVTLLKKHLKGEMARGVPA